MAYSYLQENKLRKEQVFFGLKKENSFLNDLLFPKRHKSAGAHIFSISLEEKTHINLKKPLLLRKVTTGY